MTEEETIGEQIIEAIEKDIKYLPQFFKNEHTGFQDRHTGMQTYLLFRMLEEIEGIHNGFYVLHNEKAASQSQDDKTITVDRDYLEHLLGLMWDFLHSGVHLMNEDARQEILYNANKAYNKGMKLLKHSPEPN